MDFHSGLRINVQNNREMLSYGIEALKGAARRSARFRRLIPAVRGVRFLVARSAQRLQDISSGHRGQVS